MPRLLSLDASLKHSGLAYRGLEHPIYYTLDFKGQELGYELAEIYSHLIQLCKKEKFTHCIKEALVYGMPSWAQTRLAEVSGVIRAALYKSNVKLVEVAPKTAKKLIAGSGNATKQDVMDAVVKRLNVNPLDDNQSDALAIMLVGEAYLQLCLENEWVYGDVKISQHSKEIEGIINKC